ncbi:hypothetical protein [Parabacteroides goldsteinii]|uniref:hypothetical protein n=1 Tax=Parabacteroides goldsteinii TaxID=328812 RepID=UPI00189BCFC7|nr:hypothetical protein [Parabacteroides goldsteinii]
MKFQNLIYATMVACAFSACSNDDDPNIPDPAQELDATLTVAFNAVGSNGSGLKSQTKSNAQGSEVGKIGIAVFNDGAMTNMAMGTLINYKERIANTATDTTDCIDAKAGAVNVLVVVNPPEKVFEGKTTLEGFKEAISAANLNSAQPLMASATISYDLKKGRNVASTDAATLFPVADNRFTDNIKVFRNVANIDLESITLRPRADFATDAKLVVSKAFIMHYRSNVKVFGVATAWCPVVNDASDNIVSNSTGTEGIYTHSFSQDITGTSEVKVSAENGEFFVYDNSSSTQIANVKKATALVIQGTYTYTASNGQTVTSKDAYWTVYINNNEVASNVTNDSGYTNLSHFGVLRNVKYVINATITGPGSDDPETPTGAASITSNIEIVPWGTVALNPDID